MAVGSAFDRFVERLRLPLLVAYRAAVVGARTIQLRKSIRVVGGHRRVEYRLPGADHAGGQAGDAAVNVFERYHAPYTPEMKPAVEFIMNKRIVVRIDPVRTRSWDHRKLGWDRMPVTSSTAEFVGQ